MKHFIFLTLFILIAANLMAQSQEGQLKGRIAFPDGTPAPFVTVTLKNADLHVVTDANGEFILSAPAGEDKLLIQAVNIKDAVISVQLKSAFITQLNIVVEENISNLEQVVVSASRNIETIDDVPSSVTLISSKELEASRLITSNIIDILEMKVPGLAPSTGTSSNWGQTLRGRPMLIMIDGIPQSTPLRNGAVDMRSIDPASIERIEVIKGATAIYGNGAAGGLINYITKNPVVGDPFSSYTSMAMTGSLAKIDNSIGSRLTQQFSGNIGKLDYVLSGSFEQTGEFKDAEGDVLPPTYGLGETDSYNAFLKLRYRMNTSSQVQFTFNHYASEQKTNYVPLQGDYLTETKTKAVPGTLQGVPQGVRGNTNANLQFSGADVIGKTDYNVDLYYQNVDNVFFWSTSFVDGGQSMISSEKTGLRFVFHTPFELNGLNSEISYGMDFLRDVTSQPLVDGRTWVPEMDMTGAAPFVQLKAELASSLILKGGFRMERVNIGVENYETLATVNPVTGAVNPSFDVKGGELSYNAWVFNAGIRYNKFDLFTPYASFSQGFSVSDVGLMLRSAKVDSISKINTDAIIINNYEAGFVSKYKRLRFEGVGYISTSELGASGRFKDGIFEMVRSPEKIYGFEIISDLRINKNSSAGITYSWLEGKLDVDDNGHFTDNEDVYLGGERISAPKLTAFVSYALFAGKLNLNLYYTSIRTRDRFDINENGSYNVYQGPIEAYNLVNLLARFNLTAQTSINAGIENLFNEDYFPARSQWFTLPSLYTKGKGTAFQLTLTHRL